MAHIKDLDSLRKMLEPLVEANGADIIDLFNSLVIEDDVDVVNVDLQNQLTTALAEIDELKASTEELVKKHNSELARLFVANTPFVEEDLDEADEPTPLSELAELL